MRRDRRFRHKMIGWETLNIIIYLFLPNMRAETRKPRREHRREIAARLAGDVAIEPHIAAFS